MAKKSDRVVRAINCKTEYQRAISKSWSKGLVTWEDDETVYHSVVFSWHIPKLTPHKHKHTIVGGPAIYANPDLVPEWAEVGYSDRPLLSRHNPFATRTSTGCIRSCKFCIVPKTEGRVREIDDYRVYPIVIDNNLLACSKKHFDTMIDRFKRLDWCDFNQGLDARLLTPYHAYRFTELKNPIIRLAFDDVRYEAAYVKCARLLLDVGIPASHISTYVLIGFNDSPDDALYRLRTVTNMGITVFPMRYQPTDTLKKNSYIQSPWTHDELDRYMSYWANLRITNRIPFDDYIVRKDYRAFKKIIGDK